MALKIRIKKKKNCYWINAFWSGTNKDDELVKLGITNHTFFDNGSPFIWTLDYQDAINMYMLKWEKDKTIACLSGGKKPKFDPQKQPEVKSAGRRWSDQVAINSVTTNIIRLLKDPKALNASSGSMDPFYYRAKLIGCLSSLWC